MGVLLAIFFLKSNSRYGEDWLNISNIHRALVSKENIIQKKHNYYVVVISSEDQLLIYGIKIPNESTIEK